MSSDLRDAYRRIGVSRARRTVETILQQQATAIAIDTSGKINPRSAPRPTPLVMAWGPSSTTRYRTARAGTVVLLAAYASTAPSTADAVITLSQITEAGGLETLASVTIPEGANFSDPDTLQGCPVDVPAGAWLLAAVTTSGSASGVSMSATIDTGVT